MSTGIDMDDLPRPFVTIDLWPAQLRQLRFLESSARVVRWHTEPVIHRQSVGEHTYSVMQLILLLTQGQASAALLAAALMHDTPERKFGDVPGPTKRLTGLKRKFDELEAGFMEELGLTLPTQITQEEAEILKMADMLEGGMFCAFELRRGNRDIQEGFYNYLTYIHGAPGHTDLSEAIYNQLRKEYVNVFGE